MRFSRTGIIVEPKIRKDMPASCLSLWSPSFDISSRTGARNVLDFLRMFDSETELQARFLGASGCRMPESTDTSSKAAFPKATASSIKTLTTSPRAQAPDGGEEQKNMYLYNKMRNLRLYLSRRQS